MMITKPKTILKCLTDRYMYRQELKDIAAQTNLKNAYYGSALAEKLTLLIETVAVQEVVVAAGDMEARKWKLPSETGIKKEWTQFTRPLNDKNKCNLDNAKDKVWADVSLKKAVIPLLYMMNVLVQGDEFRLASDLKHYDQGTWSPNHLDMFVALA